MTSTTLLHALGQSVWLDNISRDLLSSGTLQRYYNNYGVTGLTSNPSIFEHAIQNTTAYDVDIITKVAEGKSSETVFFELALDDLRQAAAVFKPIHEASEGIDGWVSLEVSPLLANDTQATIVEAKRLHGLTLCPNLFIKVPGNPAGVLAIEELIFSGIPINVTLLFSQGQYIAANNAYCRGIQRRIGAGLDPKVVSVASIFVSRWDTIALEYDPDLVRSRLGVAMADRIYKASCERMASPEWAKLIEAGAVPQRLLWASTGTKDPTLSDTYYVESLAAPNTINTMPEKTLLAFAEHGQILTLIQEDGGDSEYIIADFVRKGLDIDALAIRLQLEGIESFAKSWEQLLQVITSKCKPVEEMTFEPHY